MGSICRRSQGDKWIISTSDKWIPTSDKWIPTGDKSIPTGDQSIIPTGDKPILTGDPSVFGNFDPPPEVLKAVSDVLKTSCYGYAPAHGSYTAREAIAEYYTTENSPLTAEVIIFWDF